MPRGMGALSPALRVKPRGAFRETGDGEGVAALTPFNLRWQFQFPAEKDISHSRLKKPQITLFS